MKTKIVLSTLALSLSVLAFAQEKTNLEKRITNYSMKVDSIVSAEKIKMNLELNSIEKQFAEGKISEVKMQEERNRISTNYSQTINEKIDAEKEELDEITKVSAQNAVMGKNDADHEKSKRKVKSPKELLKTGGFVFSTGFLNVTEDNNSFDLGTNNSDVHAGKSGSGNIAYLVERQIGKYASPVFVNFGLGIRSDSYDLRNDKVFTQNSNQLQLSTFTSGNLKYSRLKVDFIELPVNFNFVLNPKYVDYDGEKYIDATRSQLRVGLGVYGGVKIGNRIRYKYSNAESSKNIFIQSLANYHRN